jgi:hypothetical protein
VESFSSWRSEVALRGSREGKGNILKGSEILPDRDERFSEEERKAVHVVPEEGEVGQPPKKGSKLSTVMTVLDGMRERLESERDKARREWIAANQIATQTEQTALDDIVHVDEYRRIYQVALARYEGASLMWAAAMEAYEREKSGIERNGIK